MLLTTPLFKQREALQCTRVNLRSETNLRNTAINSYWFSKWVQGFTCYAYMDAWLLLQILKTIKYSRTVRLLTVSEGGVRPPSPEKAGLLEGRPPLFPTGRTSEHSPLEGRSPPEGGLSSSKGRSPPSKGRVPFPAKANPLPSKDRPPPSPKTDKHV